MNALERVGYLAHARTAGHRRRIEQSRDIVRAALAMGPEWYVSMSFGKDSTVMTHLILALEPALPVYYLDCGEWDEWPDTPRVIEAFRLVCPCALVTLQGPSIIEYYRRVGYIYHQDMEQTREARAAQREYGASLEKIIVAEAKAHGLEGAFIGMRAEESHWRSYQLHTRGPLYYHQGNEQWHCSPLAHWTGQDVWAYIVANGLPWNELYDMHPSGRERARNGAMIGTRDHLGQRLAWLRSMYPQRFNELSIEFPEIRRAL